jgi:hypothetical protein
VEKSEEVLVVLLIADHYEQDVGVDGEEGVTYSLYVRSLGDSQLSDFRYYSFSYVAGRINR